MFPELLERITAADLARWHRTAEDAAAVAALVRQDRPDASDAEVVDAVLALWGGSVTPEAAIHLADRELDYGDICRVINWLNRTPMRAVFSAAAYRC